MNAEHWPGIPDVHSSTRRTSRRRGSAEAAPPDPAQLRIAAADASVTIDDVLNSPMISELLAEDSCWCAGMDAWRARRPGLLHLGARRVWRAQRAPLDDKRDRVRLFAAEQGITPAAGGGSRRKARS